MTLAKGWGSAVYSKGESMYIGGGALVLILLVVLILMVA